jgi:hypothetical protein
MQEKKETLVRVTQLVTRGKAKIEQNESINLPLKPSLRALQFLLKANVNRPLWTYDIERMSHLRFMRISRFSFTDK